MAGTTAHFPVVRRALASLPPEELKLHSRDEVFETFLKLHPKLKETFFLNTKEEESDPYESSQFTVLIANAHGVDMQTRWGGSQNLFGGEGGFVLQATGQGEVVLGSYGAVDTLDLGPGEAVTIDSGHVVAYDAGVQSRLRRAVEGRSVQSLKSGEGFVFDFTGPGRVMIQTRSLRALIDWLTTELPFSRN